MSADFDAWMKKDIHKGKLFITDGVIDDGLWEKTDTKILFLLKEAYDSKRTSGSWDLPKLIRKRGVSGRTFKPMAQWAYGIHQIMSGKGITPYLDDGEKVRNALLSSSIVNLKKSDGKKSSKTSVLNRYVEEDWELIYSQIASISPQIVICGKTWPFIKNKLKAKKLTDRAYIFDDIIYINFWHPSNRASNLMNYYSICAIVEMAIKESNKSTL